MKKKKKRKEDYEDKITIVNCVHKNLSFIL